MLYAGLPLKSIWKLQWVENVADRLPARPYYTCLEKPVLAFQAQFKVWAQPTWKCSEKRFLVISGFSWNCYLKTRLHGAHSIWNPHTLGLGGWSPLSRTQLHQPLRCFSVNERGLIPAPAQGNLTETLNQALEFSSPHTSPFSSTIGIF